MQEGEGSNGGQAGRDDLAQLRGATQTGEGMSLIPKKLKARAWTRCG